MTFRHGQILVVTKRDATALSGNVCTFRLGYGFHATGDTGGSFFKKIKLRSGRAVHTLRSYYYSRIRQQRTVSDFINIKLKPVRQSSNEPGLPTNYGIAIGVNHKVRAKSRYFRLVKESNYNNNVVKLKVILNGDCSRGRIVKPGDQGHPPIHRNKIIYGAQLR